MGEVRVTTYTSKRNHLSILSYFFLLDPNKKNLPNPIKKLRTITCMYPIAGTIGRNECTIPARIINTQNKNAVAINAGIR